MKRRSHHLFRLLAIVVLLAVSAGAAGASGGAPMSDWSAWQAYFTPIVPATPHGPASPAGLPIPTQSPSNALLQAWVNMIPSLPEPAQQAHAEEVARGPNHSTIVGHGPAATGAAARNEWAYGHQLLNSANPGPFFETFDNFYGTTWRQIPHLWGAYAYRGADSVVLTAEKVVKDESPYDGSYSMKIAASVPFEAGVSREIHVPPGSEVKVRAMYVLYDHGGLHDGSVLTYDWASLGVKCDDMDAEWVNGPWHGQWLPLEHTVIAGPEGRIMIFLQVISPLAENVNAYFDDVQVWVDGAPYEG
jgi:hypothetical protein